MSPKRAARQEKFKKIGEAITALSSEFAWRDRKGDHQFDPKNADHTRYEIPGGPKFKTPQWERTVRS